MKLEDQVCALEYATKLKELGVKQDGIWYWHKPFRERPWMISASGYDKDLCRCKNNFSAFTVAELGEMLPAYTNINGDECKLHLSKYFRPGNGLITYSAEYWVLQSHSYTLGKGCYDVNESNVRAEMLIYLLENKLMMGR